jgi:hypothetical protein
VVGAGDQAAQVEALAEQLGRSFRWAARAELRGLPKLLEPGERVLALALGSSGVRGRLVAVTDQRILLVYKHSLRPLRHEEFRYALLSEVEVHESETTPKLVLASQGNRRTLSIAPPPAADELASTLRDLVGPRLRHRHVSAEARPPAGDGKAKGLVILVLVCAAALTWTWYSAGEPEPVGPVPYSEVRACVREKLADEDWAKEARQEIPRDLVPRDAAPAIAREVEAGMLEAEAEIQCGGLE